MAKAKDNLDTEQRILLAAKKVFVERGFDGARMQHIADEAGINKALLHYYFRKKERLFEVVMQSIIREFAGQVRQLVDDDTPVLVKIQRFLTAHFTYIQEFKGLFIFFVSEMNRNPDTVKQQFEATDILTSIRKFRAVIQQHLSDMGLSVVKTEQLLLSLAGLNLIGILAQPLFCYLFELSEEEYGTTMQERPQHIQEMLMKFLMTKQE